MTLQTPATNTLADTAYETALEQFERAARYVHADPNYLNILKFPRREMTIISRSRWTTAR